MKTQMVQKIVLALVILSSGCGAASSGFASVTEDMLVRRDDAIDAHNKLVAAEMAREKSKAQLEHAKVVYEMALRLGQTNTSSKWEIYEKLIDLLHAQIADRVATHMVIIAGLDEQIGSMRRTWREGSAPVDVPALARLMVEKREAALRIAEGSMADFRQMADARKAMSDIQEDLARRRVISEEDRHLSMVLKNQALAESTIWASELEVAKTHLEEAKRDLENAGR